MTETASDGTVSLRAEVDGQTFTVTPDVGGLDFESLAAETGTFRCSGSTLTLTAGGLTTILDRVG